MPMGTFLIAITENITNKIKSPPWIRPGQLTASGNSSKYFSGMAMKKRISVEQPSIRLSFLNFLRNSGFSTSIVLIILIISFSCFNLTISTDYILTFLTKYGGFWGFWGRYKKPLVHEGKCVWAMRDLNSRLPPCKGGTLNQLS